ncbi:MAG: alpha/beta fold hydrolase [Anaerolineales bacterium]|nr:alpha/beta fold hydrolase [Anaerolineales bacterium]
MSAITINGDLLHYEVLGRGRPVILLHSWLGSWRYWIPTMQQLSMKYRTYAVDLWGFGDSGKNKFYYGIEGQVELLEKFIERMGIPKAVFIGHGLGAVVATQFSVKPGCTDVVHRMMAIGLPLFDTPRRPRIEETPESPPDTDAPTIVKVSPEERERLRLALSKGYTSTPEPPPPAIPMSGSVPMPPAPPSTTTPSDSKPATSTTTTVPAPTTPPAQPTPSAAPASTPSTPAVPPSPSTPKTSTATNVAVNPLMTHVGKTKPGMILSRHMDTSSADYEKMKGEVEKADDEAFLTSIQSLSEHNPFHNLQDSKAPTLAVYGSSDTFIQMPDKALLQKLEGRDDFRVITLPDIRHFPMLEDTTTFTRLLREFLDAPTIADIEIKEEWRRRTR